MSVKRRPLTISARALLEVKGPVESIGCIMQLKSPPISIGLVYSENRTGSSSLKKRSRSVRFAVPDGAYTLIIRIPQYITAIALPDGILSICVIWRPCLASMAVPHLRANVVVNYVSGSVYTLWCSDLLHQYNVKVLRPNEVFQHPYPSLIPYAIYVNACNP